MNLTTETMLRGVADALRDRIAPALSDGFAGEAARLAQMLLALSANAVDDAAALRVAENASLRGLLGDAAAMATGEQAARLAAAGASADPGLRISELDAENGRLRGLLVEWHAMVERLDGEPARAMDRRIWALLREIETARAPRG